MTLTGGSVPVKGNRQKDEIALRLENVIARMGETQTSVARRLSDAGYKVSQTSVGEYVRGESTVPAVFLVAFCRVLDVNPMWLLIGEGPVELHEARTTGGAADARYLEREIRKTLRRVMGEISDDEFAEFRDVSGLAGEGPEDGGGNGSE